MMTFGEFLDRVCGKKYKAALCASKGSFEFGGKADSISYLHREDESGNSFILIVPPGRNRETLVTDDVVRSACEQLGIDPVNFAIEGQPPN